eukprot:TRINITY_DN112910_c0_g1_i1.p1 TRINITY_DN112910_c0_g1~~TRINITY_DN112910_c0_g1_i1.p1  ORF type:complete len:773 (+),score=129.96 TRINITY_DN112910_c0_g1_i1:209-2527(+)
MLAEGLPTDGVATAELLRQLCEKVSEQSKEITALREELVAQRRNAEGGGTAGSLEEEAPPPGTPKQVAGRGAIHRSRTPVLAGHQSPETVVSPASPSNALTRTRSPTPAASPVSWHGSCPTERSYGGVALDALKLAASLADPHFCQHPAAARSSAGSSVSPAKGDTISKQGSSVTAPVVTPPTPRLSVVVPGGAADYSIGSAETLVMERIKRDKYGAKTPPWVDEGEHNRYAASPDMAAGAGSRAILEEAIFALPPKVEANPADDSVVEVNIVIPAAIPAVQATPTIPTVQATPLEAPATANVGVVRMKSAATPSLPRTAGVARLSPIATRANVVVSGSAELGGPAIRVLPRRQAAAAGSQPTLVAGPPVGATTSANSARSPSRPTQAPQHRLGADGAVAVPTQVYPVPQQLPAGGAAPPPEVGATPVAGGSLNLAPSGGRWAVAPKVVVPQHSGRRATVGAPAARNLSPSLLGPPPVVAASLGGAASPSATGVISRSSFPRGRTAGGSLGLGIAGASAGDSGAPPTSAPDRASGQDRSVDAALRPGSVNFRESSAQRRGGTEQPAQASVERILRPSLRIRPPSQSEGKILSSPRRTHQDPPMAQHAVWHGTGAESASVSMGHSGLLAQGQVTLEGTASPQQPTSRLRKMPSAQGSNFADHSSARSPPRPATGPSPAPSHSVFPQQPPQVLHQPPAQLVVRGSFPSSASAQKTQIGLQSNGAPGSVPQQQPQQQRIYATAAATPQAQATLHRNTVGGYPAANQGRFVQRINR